jgi:hypothetical protein
MLDWLHPFILSIWEESASSGLQLQSPLSDHPFNLHPQFLLSPRSHVGTAHQTIEVAGHLNF